jgi:catechol 2,3-dioxygenase-like lactoylglutathione lyase family enzyme
MPDATAPQQAPIAIHLLHPGLPVRDQRRSLRFYQTYFGFEPASARHHPEGTVIVRNADGFDLALHPGVLPDQPAAFLHFGFQLPGAAAVLELLARMEVDGVPILERWEESSYVAFKCLDPDGWRVEVTGSQSAFDGWICPTEPRPQQALDRRARVQAVMTPVRPPLGCGRDVSGWLRTHWVR